jgi:predicted nucleic acid-binding protein
LKLPDVNLLIYAYDSTSAHNEGARIWLQDMLSGPEQIGFTWLVLLGFLRLSTHHKYSQSHSNPRKRSASSSDG